MKPSETMKILQRPFPAGDVEWRIAQCGMKKGDKGPWAKVLAYITARAVHERLDEAFGLFGWKNEFREFTVSETYESDLPETPEKKRGKSANSTTGVICRIWFRDPDTGDWCWKENGAPQTGYEAFKGGLSDAEKRTFAELGGGRYLYKLKDNWAIIGAKKSPETPYYQPAKKGVGATATFWWGPPPLPAFALPDGKPQRHMSHEENKAPEEDAFSEEGETKEPAQEPAKDASMPSNETASGYPNVKIPVGESPSIANMRLIISIAQDLKWGEEQFITWFKGIIRKDLAEASLAQTTLLLQRVKALSEKGAGE